MREQVDYTGELSEQAPEVQAAYMYDWVFHYNPFTNSWIAIPREQYNKYWNGEHTEHVLKARHLNVLVELLHKCKGDAEMIHDITRSSDLL